MTDKHKRARAAARIPKKRWLAYSVAGASALAGASHAEADITYSGPLNIVLDANEAAGSSTYFYTFFGENSSGVFSFIHLSTGGIGGAFFTLSASSSAMFAGSATSGTYRYAYNLPAGVYVSAQDFVSQSGLANILAYSSTMGHFRDPGTGFVAFKFDGGAGTRYGWIRLTMDGAPDNSYTLVDFAYADVDEPIRTAQIPEPGGLGLLALGAAGVAYRRRRAKRISHDGATR